MDVQMTTERIGNLRLDRARPDRPTGAAPVLYVHGMWGGSWYFENYLRFTAARGREAWAINLRGHHGSRPVADLARVTLEEYVHDVADVLDAIGPAVVVGHSMGGLLAQAVAARPDVGAAVFMASVPPAGLSLLRWALLRRAPRYLPAALGPRAFRVREADARALALNAVPAALQAGLAARFVHDSGRVARQLALGALPSLPRPRCPVLVVGAARDRLTPAALQRRIAARYGADYIEAAECGHMLPIEPDWLPSIRGVLAWLDARTARTHEPAPSSVVAGALAG